ncbi:MAG: hypothetical protein KY459_12685 [Acidobacteria bacterium]|nr:hypothetical protein [Acidobacteriota bacterium]
MSRYSPVEQRLRREVMSRTPAPEKQSSSLVPLIGIVVVIVAAVAILFFTEREPYEPPSLDAHINEINNRGAEARKKKQEEVEREVAKLGPNPDINALKEQIDRDALEREERRRQQREENMKWRLAVKSLKWFVIAALAILLIRSQLR